MFIFGKIDEIFLLEIILTPTTVNDLISLNKHHQTLVAIFVEKSSVKEKLANIEQILGIDTLETIKNYLLDPDFYLYGFSHLTRDKHNHWHLFENFQIIPFVIAYYKLKQETNLDYRDKCFDYLNFKIEVQPRVWTGISRLIQIPNVSTKWPQILNDRSEKFFGCYNVDLYEYPKGFPLENAIDKQRYRTIIEQVNKCPNSSAVFCVYDNTYVEPVLVVNIDGKTEVILSGSHIHSATDSIIKSLKLTSHKRLKVVHDGDCSFYSTAAINIVASLAREEGSITEVLTQLVENEIDLTNYYLNLEDFINLDENNTLNQPDPMTLNRLFLKLDSVLKAANLHTGFKKMLLENGIDTEGFMMKPDTMVVEAILSESKIQAIDSKLTKILNDLDQKINLTTILTGPEILEVAENLSYQLKEAKKKYITALQQPQGDKRLAAREFRHTCSQLISDNLPLLQRDLGWGDYLKNLLKKIANAVIYIVTLGDENSFFSYKASTLATAATQTEDELMTARL